MAVRSLVLAGAIAGPQAPLSDLDAFMADVLDRRDENWKQFQ